MSESTVKVGVRIRPLLPKERHQTISLSSYNHESVQFKNQTFTYDNVFGSELTQHELYQNTAAPMLRSFIEGYNVTIIAYGQTGSGKTYTMGTSDVNLEDSECQGLIPRFVSDLFENLAQISQNEKLAAKVSVSFLEIYGEDVYDLNDSKHAERNSLLVRENDGGHVFVQGLQETCVENATDALEILSCGSRNRITASTAMNAGSSRSHAVYTIKLNQVVQSTDSEDDTHRMCSKLTFVDLAGSERIKRTGAEGQRLKEGIQINSGLFNLGQVINGLADDQKLKQGKQSSHIPYRNSKLTHLLKDALGGNSKTLFLACVSPAECNESETYSTLSYARQARNIQNKPVVNMDKHQLEVRRLKYAVKAWMYSALNHIFDKSKNHTNGDSCLSPSRMNFNDAPFPSLDFLDIGTPVGHHSSYSKEYESHELLNRPEVQSYISLVNQKIESLLQGANPSPRKVRLSIAPTSPKPPSRHMMSDMKLGPRKLFREDVVVGVNAHGSNFTPHSPSNGGSLQSFDGGIEDRLQGIEDTEKLVDRMLEFVHKEKESHHIHDQVDEPCNDNSTDCDNVCHEVDKEILEKEEILIKLKDAVKSYASMKEDYEHMVDKIASLENERMELESALEQAKKQEQSPVASGGGAASTANKAFVDRLKDRFQLVKDELSKMKSDVAKKEAAYKQIQRESRMMEKLQDELQKLKEMKVTLLRTQKSQTKEHMKYKKEQHLKMTQLKKLDVKKQQQMNSLKAELTKKKRVLDIKDREIQRVQSKLKASEDHIKQLLKIQSKSRQRLPGVLQSSASNVDDKSFGMVALGPSEIAHLQSSKAILENLINDRVDARFKKSMFTKKSKCIAELNNELNVEVAELDRLRAIQLQIESDDTFDTDDFSYENFKLYENTKVAIEACEGSIDRITVELAIQNADFQSVSKPDDREESDNWEELGKAVISGLSVHQCQSVIWDLMYDKSEQLDKLRVAEETVDEAEDMYQSNSESVKELQRQLDDTKAEMRVKLEEAEKRKNDELWSVLSTQNGNNNNLQAASMSVVQCAENAAIARTQELENTLTSFIESDEKMRAQLKEMQDQNLALHAKVQDLVFKKRVGLAERDGIDEDEGDMAKWLKGMQSAWEKLGISMSDREAIFIEVDQAGLKARNKAYLEAKETIQKAIAEEDVLSNELEVVCGVMDVVEGQYLKGESVKEIPLLQRLDKLRVAANQARVDFNSRYFKLVGLQDKFAMLNVDMKLADSEVPPELRRIIKLNLNASFSSLSEVERGGYFLDMGYMLRESDLQIVNSTLRQISITQAGNIAKSNELREEIIHCSELLGYLTAEHFEGMSLNSSSATSNQNELQLIQESKLEAIDAVLNKNCIISGNARLLHWFEAILVSLKKIKIDRERSFCHMLNVLLLFEKSVGVQIPSYITELEGISDIGYDYNDVMLLLNAMEDIRTPLTNAVNIIQSRLFEKSAEVGYRADDYDRRMESLSKMNITSDPEKQKVAEFTQWIQQLQGMVSFLDEIWLKNGIVTFQSTWADCYEELVFAIILQSEEMRIDMLMDAVKELNKIDSQLITHAVSMEDFEVASKQDRAKALNGNSKLLIEEEKFRKNGKRKYEQLSEKLLQAAQMVHHYGDGFHVDCSKLSLACQDLLKGKFQDRLELMHLHTTTHGLKRWSGDKETFLVDQNENSENSVSNAMTPLPRHKSPVKSVMTKGAPKHSVSQTLLAGGGNAAANASTPRVKPASTIVSKK